MTPQTEMSLRDRADLAGVAGVGGALFAIENIALFAIINFSLRPKKCAKKSKNMEKNSKNQS